MPVEGRGWGVPVEGRGWGVPVEGRGWGGRDVGMGVWGGGSRLLYYPTREIVYAQLKP